MRKRNRTAVGLTLLGIGMVVLVLVVHAIVRGEAGHG